jgi:predicted nuclease of predicted toxin-antitoxin system
MKLLLDENLSRRLLPALQAEFPGSSQVALLGLEQVDDRGVWEYARAHDFVIVSKDADFQDLQAAWGYPPKIILIALGNCFNQSILHALTNSASQLQETLAQELIGLVELV